MIASLYLHSQCRAKPLRLGVMVDGFFLPAAFRRILTDILNSDFARLELAVVHQHSAPAQPTAENKISAKLAAFSDRDLRSHFFYALYQKLDSRLASRPDPLEMIDCSDLLTGLPRLDVVPVAKRFVHRFPPEAMSALKSYDLDVLLRFGFGILRGEVLKGARYGIWSYHHGDNEFYRGGPPMFWELVEESLYTGVVLQVLTEELDDGQTLCKAMFPTKRGLWRHENAFAPFWGSTHFVIRKLHELHERGWEHVEKACLPQKPYRGKSAVYRAPSNGEFVRWFAPRIVGKVVRAANPFRKTQRYHWRICLARRNACRVSEPNKAIQYKWMPAPPGHMYADPFLFKKDDQLWLFFEDYSYAEERAVIRCGQIQQDLSVGPLITCLDLPYHVSYPAVFSHDGEIFMIPESASNKDVELWRATNFPSTWKLEKTLFRGLLMDTTPIRHDGRWYFLTTIAEPENWGIFGALFWANSLTGDWVHHPSSPICTDVRYARSAGAVHKADSGLLRPVQDCGKYYGRRIHVKKILELSPEVYREVQLCSIEPDWEEGLLGTHTYSYCDGIEVLDGVKYVNEDEVVGQTDRKTRP